MKNNRVLPQSKKQLRKRQLEINDLLFEQCDPGPYIKFYEDSVNSPDKSKDEHCYESCKLNLSTGLIAAGRYDEAREVLKKCEHSGHDHSGTLPDISRLYNLCFSYVKLGRIDEAEDCLDELNKSMSSLRDEERQKYCDIIKSAQNGINAAKGVFDNTESLYSQAFSEAANNYGRVSAKFGLGKVYLHYGDATRAKEAFEYVVSHGNKLHIAEEAKEYLKQITE